jgi:hypothetical protein
MKKVVVLLLLITPSAWSQDFNHRWDARRTLASKLRRNINAWLALSDCNVRSAGWLLRENDDSPTLCVQHSVRESWMLRFYRDLMETSRT